MINQLNIPINSSLSAKLTAASKHYNLDEQGLLLLALEDFLSRDEKIRQELIEDEARFQDVILNNNGISNSVVMQWINEEITALRYELPQATK